MNHRLFMLCSILLAFQLSATFGTTPNSAIADEIDFSTEIQPIFAQRCYACHGPTEKEGGLQLNSREAALAELESGDHAIVPGKDRRSTILDRILSEDEGDQMPPEGKRLTPDQIEKIKKWIEQGAKWGEHWAFAQPVRNALPKTSNPSWVKTPIDAFVLAKLDKEKLTPAKQADKIALVRRAYYDLIGLPPTPQQVSDFLKDDSANAYEKLIDRLLDSDQYGEKWARHWLDLVRYAETNGYERDSRKNLIWKYRDYVIRSFNQDKPFDRFIMEQLAGDELKNRTPESIIATGFYRLGVWDDEPADRELARYDYMDDILRTTSETFLGMTIGCARCHDHKIDPVAQRDYYSLLSFFSDISPHGGGSANHVSIETPEERAAFDNKVADKLALETRLKKEIEQIESDFVAKLKKEKPEINIDDQPKLPANGILLSNSVKKGQQWEYTFKKPEGNWFDIAFDDSGWKKGEGGFGSNGTPGSHVRTQWRTNNIWLRKDFRLASVPGQLSLHIIHDENAEVYLNGRKIAAVNGYRADFLKIDVTEKAQDVLQTGRNTLAVHCKQTAGGQYIDVQLSTDRSATPNFVFLKKYGEEILGKQKLDRWNLIRQQYGKSIEQKLKFKTDFAMAVAERGRNKTWILGRGSPQNKGEEVGPAFPQILNPPKVKIESKKGPTTGKRKRLAEWIASPENPMTAKVMINRIWQFHFGNGLVRSSSDFGFQGTPPTHPELLDWLAKEFTSSGWKIKKIHKLIMMSSTYQMSSAPNKVALEKDPTNNWLWRYNLRRLTAEEIRDSILAVSGDLNLKMYGSFTFPKLPREVLATSSTPGSVWGNSPLEEANRRSIYIHVKRSMRMPLLESFDSPDPDTTCSVRVSTTVPTQALGMLNSQFMNEQAQRFSDRLEKEHPGNTRMQIKSAIRLTTSREAQADEIDADLKFIQELVSEEKLDQKKAMQNYCLMILNTNEFFYID